MVPPEPNTPGSELERHRTRITRVLLVGFVAVGLLAYLPSMWLALKVGAWGIAVVDTAVYVALLAVLPLGRPHYRLQAGVVVGVCYVLGLVLSVVLGPAGAGLLWLMGTPVAAAILFDRRTAVAALALITLTVGGIALLAARDLLAWAEHDASGSVLWVVLGTNALLLACALALAVTALIRGLQHETAERQRAEEQLRQAEKLQAIGTLAAGIAHDFNNLLTPILSATEMARADAEEGSAPRAALDQAIEAAMAGRMLVRRILAFSRPSGGGRLPMQASAAFRDAVRLLRASIPGSTAVELEVHGDGVILLSPVEVHQIVLNLGLNAHKAMAGGGTLRFRLSAVAGDAIDWHALTGRPDRVARLEVSDTGAGMSPEIARRIFEPFFTTDPHAGTGVGLATVHGIVVSTGGQIVCSSSPGAGTTFTLDLPCAAPEAVSGEAAPPADPAETAAPEPAPATEAPGEAGVPHVVVVDDEQPVRDIARRVLQRQGYRVTSVSSGLAALAVLNHEPLDVAVVLSDLHMPEMTGLQLAARVRTGYPAVAVILMSGLVDEQLLDQAESAGVRTVIAKPFRLQELVDAVADAL